MSDRLTIVRHGSGDDVLLEAAAARAPLYFRTGVHWSEADLLRQAAQLRAFLAQVPAPAGQTRFALAFGVDDYRYLRLTFDVHPMGQVDVTVSMQDNFGDTARPRFDRCTLHLDTDVASLDRFAAELAGIMADEAPRAELAVR
ncbi:hypothetical protein IP92_04770 [Pseudoduganella flava]|uniref:Condensation domain-containing protein n=1 Tax=Pseudoduganella flava TaxID=871742 RepID=A0A562PH06_9BURK|nr:hypothetical protein [Pseudoduganella flava]QGZ42566.1 hypothetical protein GO485_28380 [Pseudoduganella flava]TWI43717.1 hypothetical protein IP92_04770 [Pseudoduganella flava]